MPSFDLCSNLLTVTLLEGNIPWEDTPINYVYLCFYPVSVGVMEPIHDSEQMLNTCFYGAKKYKKSCRARCFSYCMHVLSGLFLLSTNCSLPFLSSGRVINQNMFSLFFCFVSKAPVQTLMQLSIQLR